MSYELPHLSVFLHSLPITWVAPHPRLCYRIEKTRNAVKRWELTSVPSLQLILRSHKSTHKERLAAPTNQPCPVASSHSGPFWCPSLRQWRPFSLSDSTHKRLVVAQTVSKHLLKSTNQPPAIEAPNIADRITWSVSPYDLFIHLIPRPLAAKSCRMLNWRCERREGRLAKDGKDCGLFDCS